MRSRADVAELSEQHVVAVLHAAETAHAHTRSK